MIHSRIRSEASVGRHGAGGDYRKASGCLAANYLAEWVIEENSVGPSERD